MKMDQDPSTKVGGTLRIAGSPFLRAPIFLIFLVASLVGIFATSFLSYRHILLVGESGAVSESPLCRASGIVNCDAVLQSSEAVLFGYFPSAVVGLCGFAILFWLSVNGLFVPRLRKVAFEGIMLYLCVAISFSAYFSYLMMFKEDYICTWCIVVHVTNLAALSYGLVIAFLNKASLDEPSSSIKVENVYIFASAVIVAIIVMTSAQWLEKSFALTKVIERYNELRNNPVVATALIQSSPTYDIPVNEADPVYGETKAPYAIVLFTDLQCPVCLRKELFLHAMVDINPDMLRLVIKNFPLSTDCNGKISTNVHPYACEAALAAYAAFLLGGSDRYCKYLDLIFANQYNLKLRPWFVFASQLGLREPDFQNYMNPKSQAGKKVQEDIRLGIELGLNSTPAIFFLGKRIPEDLSGMTFMKVIENLLRAHVPEERDLTLRK